MLSRISRQQFVRCLAHARELPRRWTDREAPQRAGVAVVQEWRRCQRESCRPGGREALTLIQTKVGRRIPIVLVDAAFWEGLLVWMRQRLVTDGMIDEHDLDLMQVVETPDQVVDAIFDFYEARGFLQTDMEREQLLYL